VIEIEHGSVIVRRIDWDQQRQAFAEAALERFKKTEAAWVAHETITSQH